jgi:hypothetical protein
MNPLAQINKLAPPILTLTLLFAGLSSAAAQTWVANQSGDYLEATNWVGGVAPGISSNVVFQNPDLATTSTVTFSASATNAQALFQRGVFVVQPGANLAPTFRARAIDQNKKCAADEVGHGQQDEKRDLFQDQFDERPGKTPSHQGNHTEEGR